MVQGIRRGGNDDAQGFFAGTTKGHIFLLLIILPGKNYGKDGTHVYLRLYIYTGVVALKDI